MKKLEYGVGRLLDFKNKKFTFECKEVFSNRNCHDGLYEEIILKPNPKKTFLPRKFDTLYKKINRLGSTRIIDRYIIESKIERLSKYSYRTIACKISSSSLFLDHWWLSPIKKL
jgi:hypothetical protein